MLKIRLTRTGKRNDPRFRMVVAEHTRPVKGKFIAIVGHYDPIHKDLVIKKDEIISWLGKGAQPSNRVAILLTKEGIKHSSIKIQKFHKKPKTKKGAKGSDTGAAKPEENQQSKEVKDSNESNVSEKAAKNTEEEKTQEQPKEAAQDSNDKKEEKAEEKK